MPGSVREGSVASVPRSILSEAQVHPAVRGKMASHGADIVKEVQDAVAANQIVVVGMRQNPFPKRMVFVKGVLVGGASDLKRLLESGELTRGK